MSLFKFSNYFLLRTPILPNALATDLFRLTNPKDLDDRLRYLHQDERLKEALLLASPSFFAEVEKWLNYKKDSNPKMIISLLKYTIRMSTRATPFGLFAGVSVGNFIAAEKNLSLVRNHVNKGVLKLDATILVGIIEEISKDKRIYNQLQYRINPTLYLDGKDYKYYQKVTKGKKSQNILKRVRFTPILDRIVHYFESNMKAVHYQSLTDLLQNLGASAAHSVLFVDKLISLGIICSELHPNVIGRSYLESLIKTLERVDKQEVYLQPLWTIRTLLNSAQSITKIQKAVVKLLQPIVPDHDLTNVIQGDLLIGMAENNLSKTTLNHIRDQFQDLLPLCNRSVLADLDRFKSEFAHKYEERMVRLTTALDPDIGIGYGSREGVYNITDEILGDVKNITSSSQTTGHIHHYQNLVIEKFVESVKNRYAEIQLTSTDLDNISKQRKQTIDSMPCSFYVMGNLLKSPTQERLFFNLGTLGGSSSGNLMSRFAHLDEKLDKWIKDSAEREQQQYTNAILAEISYYPDNNAGNIIHRPALRKTSICLTPTIDQEQQQIDVNDLYLFLKDQRLILWSKKFNKMVIPRLTTAHNFEHGMNLYKFLADFQFQNNRLDLSWNWGIMKEQPRLPRISYKNIILSRAQWRIQKLAKYPNEPAAFVKNLQTALEIPTMVIISNGDNELLINLENPFCIEMLLDQLCKRNTILTEYLLDDYSSVIGDKDENIFANEIIIPIEAHTQHYTNDSAPQENSLRRCFSLGSEWIYAKIYCGVHFADILLMETFPLIMNAINQQGSMRKWFFVRYNDPSPHIRLRIEISDPSQSISVISTMNSFLEQFVESGQISTISFDTYTREIERYTPFCMELSEELFYQQSEAILTTMQQSTSINDRWRLAFEYMESLLGAAKFTLPEKKDFCIRMNTLYQQEFGNNKNLWIHLNNKFKDKKDWFDNPLNNLTDFKSKLDTIQCNIFSILRANTSKDEFRAAQISLLSSYIHMFINRLFMSDQRLHELAIYHFMVGYYKMQVGKQKKNLTTIS
ncbi:lantibiotic dehydratase [Sphingobacterium sp. UGAL515B_05]|uniref:lantibiotic dehydratase n=1 Tax=Sphingobacterium sp. UGAL515B_05 TaxID=2986767 RepID=UPI002954739D|nr:lantibiotic dehydratase [Sphingobacterium sp. UGAL515B_05]WON93935.1 lantibiotic dehydratase [Sphingobacterium sp. UGAL515B_05]